jgi:hypothetical protein
MSGQQQQRSLVKNAGDPQQVKRAARVERRRQQREIDDIVAVMHSPEGRRFVAARIRICGVYGSVWEASAKIHYNAGRQDVGHQLMADIIAAAPELYTLMETEAREQQRRDDAEIAAGMVSGAEDEDQPNG